MSDGATSNRVALRFVEEVTPGTTPATPTLKNIRYTGESLDYNITYAQSKEIRDDRSVADTIPVKAESAGDIMFELSATSFDDFLEAALCGTWSTTGTVVENCEDAWNETTNANVTATADTTDYIVGSASAKFVVSAGAAAGEIIATEAITLLDLSTKTGLNFWMKSSVAVAAGNLQLLLDNTALCASPLESIDIPALNAGVWTEVNIPLAAPGGDTAIISIGLKQVIDLGAFNLWIDSVTATPRTGTLKNGVVNRSFTIQKHFQDMASPVFQNFRGMKVGSMSLDFKSGSILTGKFGFSGLTPLIGTSQVAGAVIVSSGSEVPLNSVNNLQNINENGVLSTMAFKSITVALNNTPRQRDAVGSLAAIGVALGTCAITGNLEMYFSDLVMYNRFLNSTAWALSFKAIDADGNYYTVTMPRIKIETGKMPSGGLDQDIMLSTTYRALYDPTTNCMIQIDRYSVT